MPAVTKKCRACGKEYKACPNLGPTENKFRWQDIACSPECGEVYFRRIAESRGIVAEETKKPRKSRKTSKVRAE